MSPFRWIKERHERAVLRHPAVQRAFADQEQQRALVDFERMLGAQDVPLVLDAIDARRLSALLAQPPAARKPLPPPLPPEEARR